MSRPEEQGSCAWCGEQPVVVELDGDPLCKKCADKWCFYEGLNDIAERQP